MEKFDTMIEVLLGLLAVGSTVACFIVIHAINTVL
jgi:hypothetical protein